MGHKVMALKHVVQRRAEARRGAQRLSRGAQTHVDVCTGTEACTDAQARKRIGEHRGATTGWRRGAR